MSIKTGLVKPLRIEARNEGIKHEEIHNRERDREREREKEYTLKFYSLPGKPFISFT